MSLPDELERIARVAAGLAGEGERVEAVIPAEPRPGRLVFLCAFVAADGRSWLALDPEGRPLADRALVRDAVSIAALCEIAEETAGGGDLDELRSRLVALRLTESPPAIGEAEEAVLALQRAIGAPPQLASPARLDAIGLAARRLEHALGEPDVSPFAAAMRAATDAVEALAREVELAYRGELSPA